MINPETHIIRALCSINRALVDDWKNELTAEEVKRKVRQELNQEQRKLLGDIINEEDRL